jgi:acetyl esterase/lipase
MGGSAGATLAIASARQVILGKTSLPKDAVKGVAALGPPAIHPDNVPAWLKDSHTSFVENKENVPVVDTLSMRQFYDLAGLKPDNTDYFIGLDEAMFAQYPPIYVVTSEFDPTRDDGKGIVSGLKKAGRPVKHDHFATMPHAFWLFITLPETGEFYEKLANGVEWLFSQA